MRRAAPADSRAECAPECTKANVSGTKPNSCRGIGGRRRFCFMGLSEITKRAETAMVRLANDNMVKHLNFQKLTGANKVTGHFDVSFRRG
jgi:hypothetical protein